MDRDDPVADPANTDTAAQAVEPGASSDPPAVWYRRPVLWVAAAVLAGLVVGAIITVAFVHHDTSSTPAPVSREQAFMDDLLHGPDGFVWRDYNETDLVAVGQDSCGYLATMSPADVAHNMKLVHAAVQDVRADLLTNLVETAAHDLC